LRKGEKPTGEDDRREKMPKGGRPKKAGDLKSLVEAIAKGAGLTKEEKAYKVLPREGKFKRIGKEAARKTRN